MLASFRAKRNAGFPSQGPGAGDLAKECAWLGVYIPGSVWEAKGLGCQWEPSMGREAALGRPSSLVPPGHTSHALSFLVLPGPLWTSLSAGWQLWRQDQEEEDLSPLKGAAFKWSIKY